MAPPFTKCKTRIYLSAPVNPTKELVREAIALVQGEGVRVNKIDRRVLPNGELTASAMAHIMQSDSILMVTGWMFCQTCVKEYAYAKKICTNILIQDLL